MLVTNAIIKNGLTKLSEARGSEYYLPFEIDKDMLDNNKQLKEGYKVRIKMRNYLKYDERHYLGCYDSRFVKFLTNKEELTILGRE